MICKATAIATIVVALSAALQAQNKKVTGNGVYKTIELKMEDISSINLNIDAALEVYQSTDSAGRVELYAEENVIYQIDIAQKGGNLNINFLSSWIKIDFGTIRIKVYTSKLTKAEINGGGIIRTNYPIIEKEFSAIVSGSGQFIGQGVNCSHLTSTIIGSGDISFVSGTAEKGNYIVTGSGEIRNENVMVKQLKANTNNSGNINCHATESLSTIIIGSGTIRYKGEPSIKTKTVGSGLLLPYKK